MLSASGLDLISSFLFSHSAFSMLAINLSIASESLRFPTFFLATFNNILLSIKFNANIWNVSNIMELIIQIPDLMELH